MPTDDNFIVSIDIGSSKIVVLLAEEVDGKLEVFGFGKVHSAGVEKGVIVDVEKVVQAIIKAIRTTHVDCNTVFENVSVNVSDPKLGVINKPGHVSISMNKITQKDIDSVVNNACAIPKPMNAQVINSIPNYYTLDKDPITHQGVITHQPIGQEASTLEVNMHIVSVSNECVDLIDTSIRQSGLGLLNLVLSSIASSEVYITQDEKNAGVCLIDIGAGVTNISVFINGGIVHNAVFQMGGNQINQEIANAFNMSLQEAERLKLAYGHAQVSAVKEDKLLKFQQINNTHQDYYLSYQSLIEVIEHAYLSLFSQIRQDLKSENLYHLLKSGFVLTGGASQIKGCDALLLAYFKKRAKLGRINSNKITAKQEFILSPAYACALGLLLFNPAQSDFTAMTPVHKKNIFTTVKQQLKF